MAIFFRRYSWGGRLGARRGVRGVMGVGGVSKVAVLGVAGAEVDWPGLTGARALGPGTGCSRRNSGAGASCFCRAVALASDRLGLRRVWPFSVWGGSAASSKDVREVVESDGLCP